MGQSIKLTPYLQKLEEIKKKADVLGVTHEEAVMGYVKKFVKDSSKVFRYNEESDGLQYRDFEVAFKHPEYSKYVTNIDKLFSRRESPWLEPRIDMEWPADIKLGQFNFSNVTSMNRTFEKNSCSTIDFCGIDLSMVRTMCKTFGGCSKLEKVDMGKCKLGNVTDISSMFGHCYTLTEFCVDKKAFKNVINMQRTFDNCHSIEELNLSDMDLHNVETMDNVFTECYRLGSVDLHGMDLGKLKDLSHAFDGCHGLTKVNMSGIDVHSLTSMTCMFFGCDSLNDLDLTDVNWGNNEIEITAVFGQCTSLDTLRLDRVDSEIINNLRLEMRKWNPMALKI